MKASFWLFCSFIFLSLTGIALGAADVLTEPTAQEWVDFLLSLKGINGLSALGIAGAVVQGLLYAFRSRFITMSGKDKLMIVQILSIIAGVVGLRANGSDWISSFVHANTLGAFQVFGYQVYKQFTDPGDKYILPSV